MIQFSNAVEEAVALLGKKKRRRRYRAHSDDPDKYWDDWEDDADEEIFADKKKRGTSLIVIDCILLLIQSLQLYALIQSLSLRWVWPLQWLSFAKYTFWVNLDAWDFFRLSSNVTYQSIQGHTTPSQSMPFQYWYLLMSWAGLMFSLLMTYIVVHFAIWARKSPLMFVHIAKLQWVFIYILQLLAIPFGVATGRVFYCRDKQIGLLTISVMDVNNDVECYKDNHWAYMIPVAVVAFFYYIIFPAWMIIKTKREMLNMTSERHEGYLQLKEVEYVQGMDAMWLMNHFHVFSSFKKHGCYHRAINHIIFACIIIVYAGMFNYIFYQVMAITLILLCLWLYYCIVRPYRVFAFNVMIIMSFFLFLVDGLLGSMITTFNAYSIKTVWLTTEYVMVLVALIHAFWILVAIIFVVFLILRHFNFCIRCFSSPLWPTMTSKSLTRLDSSTRTYVRAILRCKVLIERTLHMPPMFAPAHELSRQIHIINAYCRDSEFLRDPMQDSLWVCLDELIETHTQIASRSLFADSIKDSIRTTAGELMRMMPMFVRRLAQREYDFVLMNPVKRRLLLKMYCMGLFLNGRKDKVERARMTEPAVQKVWKQNPKRYESEDDGYYEEMYPEPEQGPTYRPTSAITQDLIMHDDLDDQLALEEAEMFTKNHPLSRQNYTNLAFVNEDDLSTIAEDEELRDMMEGIPSRVSTPASAMQSQVSLRSNLTLVPPRRPESQISSHGGSQMGSRISLQSKKSVISEKMITEDAAVSPMPSVRSPLASPRPGSALSDASRHTPLPGQIDDTDRKE